MSKREIEFRGKRVDNGEWIYGVPITDEATNDAYIITSTAGASLKSEINNMCATGFRVIRNTVGQYTGLTDKNGTRIFEGDIVRYNDTLHEVIFCKISGCAFFGITMPDRGEIWNFDGITRADRMEVIGNIYDNPELLKGE